ncbi:DNA-binding protein [Sodalis sp. RH19]|uniref:DNA-binding protein n=1 Tax=Sodalis sp. RH19 TaxID=3394334 RepID=UPI0039B60BF4
MALKKEWIATHELIGVGGLPKTRQGLNRRAREEGWHKRRREGARGKAVEYAWQSLPDTVKKTLSLRSGTAEYKVSQQEPSSTWLEIHRQSLLRGTRLRGVVYFKGGRFKPVKTPGLSR